MTTIIGTAGWSIPRVEAVHFPEAGSSLQRYAARFPGVEVNSSFHRPHRRSTWARWADSVPSEFRFAVKIPKEISHRRKLQDCTEVIDDFLAQVGALGDKLRILLLQLPPSFTFEEVRVRAFLSECARRTPVRIVCEPRHPSWFDGAADGLLAEFGVPRVAADPARVPAAASPSGWRELSYFRLHGTPVLYRSAYGEERLRGYAALIAEERAAGRDVWCVFDNTASSAATGDARRLAELVREQPQA